MLPAVSPPQLETVFLMAITLILLLDAQFAPQTLPVLEVFPPFLSLLLTGFPSTGVKNTIN